MNQPASDQNQEWRMRDDFLSCYFSIENEPPVITGDVQIKWFQMQINSPGETDLEKQQVQECQMEQVRLGILRIQQPINHESATNQAIQQLDQLKLQGNTIQQPVTNVPLFQQPKKIKLGPNEPCYCKSGRKYKKCHQHLDAKV